MNIWNAGRLDPDLLQDYVDNGTAEESERAQRMLDKMMEKGSHGEGSRGGNVIGHTTSGKPVYGPTGPVMSGGMGRVLAGMGGHEDYTQADHEDAAKVHNTHAKQAYADSKLPVHDPSHSTFDRASQRENGLKIMHHGMLADAHRLEAEGRAHGRKGSGFPGHRE